MPLIIPAQASQQHVESTNKAGAERTSSPLPESAYDIIAMNDLFRPTRSAPEREDTINIKAAALSKNAPVLFGTIITDNGSRAILEDPSTKVTNLYNINDSLSGYVISDIQKDKIILKNGDKTIDVNLWSEKNVEPAKTTTNQIQPELQTQPSNNTLTKNGDREKTARERRKVSSLNNRYSSSSSEDALSPDENPREERPIKKIPNIQKIKKPASSGSPDEKTEVKPSIKNITATPSNPNSQGGGGLLFR